MTIKTAKIPKALIYEIMDGKPIYYKGYKEVLKKHKKLEDIMGCSTLQAVVIDCLLSFIYAHLDRKKYRFLTNKIGNHLDLGNNISNDIAIFEKTVLTPDKINKQYSSIPPKVVIEIDIDADVEDLTNENYFHKKTQKLLDWGVEKVIWVFTESKKISVAEKNDPIWRTMNWDLEIMLLDGFSFNLADLLREEGIN